MRRPLKMRPGGCAGADGTGLAVVAVRTVGGGNTGEAVTLHNAGEALALGGAGDVDRLACLEGGGVEFLAELVEVMLGGAHLDEVATGGNPGLLEVALQGLGDLTGVDLTEAKLDSGVAVDLFGDEPG